MNELMFCLENNFFIEANDLMNIKQFDRLANCFLDLYNAKWESCFSKERIKLYQERIKTKMKFLIKYIRDLTKIENIEVANFMLGELCSI